MHRHKVLSALILSLGVLLSACSSQDTLAEALDTLPEGFYVPDRTGVGTQAVPEDALACLYEGINFGGAVICLRGDGEPGDLAVLSLPGEWDNFVSSVELRPGVSAVLFDEKRLKGQSLELSASTPWVGGEFNDKLSSLSLFVPEATPDQGGFDIQLRFNGDISDSEKAVFEAAARKWSSVITQSQGPATAVDIPAGLCEETLPAFEGTITNLLIDVQIKEIDGPGRIAGQARPCLTSSVSDLPVYGDMKIDVADFDVESSTIAEIVLQQMGRILGLIGLTSNSGEPLTSGACGADLRFSGANAVREWQALGGQGNVPLEDSERSCSNRWSEDVLDNELMTSEAELPDNPASLSRITVGALQDIGYTGVNYDSADPYELPTGGISTQSAEPRRFEFEHSEPLGPIGFIEDYAIEDYATE